MKITCAAQSALPAENNENDKNEEPTHIYEKAITTQKKIAEMRKRHRSCSQNATAIRIMVYGGLDKNNYIQTLLENVDSIQIGIQHEYSVNTSIHLHSDSNENYFKLHSPTMIDEIWAL
jgi:hypothetical protein